MCDKWLLHTTARNSEFNNDTCKVARLCRYIYHTYIKCRGGNDILLLQIRQ